MEILGSLEKENIPKTTVHFNRALKALAAGKQEGQMQGVLDQMAASGAMWDDTTVKLLVNTYVAQNALDKVLNLGRWTGVVALVSTFLFVIGSGAFSDCTHILLYYQAAPNPLYL